MDEEGKPFSSSRHRSPTFSKNEVKELVNLIDKYKHIVMNKSISASACHAKEATWTKIADRFNSRGFEYVRTADSLKMKWENLKKDARKLSKNVIDTTSNEFSALNAQIVSILCEAENNSAVDAPELEDIDNIENDEQKDSTNNSVIYWDESGEKQSQEDSAPVGDDNDRSSRMSRSLNFSPKECSLLLQCVRQEKQDVFCKEVTTKAIKMKNTAWSRITNSYNKLSPQKRSTKVLRTKFSNMKRMARQVGFKDYFRGLGGKHDKLIEDDLNAKDIKKEPEFGYKMDAEVDWNDNDEYSNHKDDENQINFAPDPLSSVLNGDSGIGSTHTESSNQSDNQEVVKLKLELLNYEMETAKLKRKKIEDALQEEAAARDSRAIETALRLRAARLDALAAQMKFPPSHPALHYTPEEARAQQYLNQYHQ